ncbi:MAG: tyrosine-type recombinase/integrase [Bacteroidaceae bacterium]|nr:tyrosine-type recombinase/integrase [Bacteroidaceae bacterium]
MDHINEFLEYLIAEKGYSQQTVITYRTAISDFVNFVAALDEDLDWNSIDVDIIRRWIAQRRENGTDARTVKKQLSALRTMYRYLMIMGITDKNPARLVTNPKVAKRLPTFLKQSEMDRLFDDTEFDDNFEGHRDHLILLTFYSTGIRVSELAGLNTSSLSLSGNEMKVLGKRNKERIVPFGEEMHNALKAYIAERSRHANVGNEEALFIDKRGFRLTVPKIRNIVKKRLTLVTNQKKRTPHTLRHTFATVMLNNGADIRAVQELLGHESLEATEVYTHLSFADMRKEYEKAHPRELHGS